MTAQKTNQDAMRILYPGTTISLHDGKLVVEVFPLAVRQMELFTSLLEEIAPRLKAGNIDLSSTFADWKAAIVTILPMMTEPVCRVLEACCVIKQPDGLSFKDIAHNDFAAVLEAWITESFGDSGKVRPWVAIIENVLTRTTGAEVQIWEKLSKLSSPQATHEETSSTTANLDSRIPDGQPRS